MSAITEEIKGSLVEFKKLYEEAVANADAANDRVAKCEAGVEEIKARITAGEGSSIEELKEHKEELKEERRVAEAANAERDAKLVELFGRVDKVEADAKRLPQLLGGDEQDSIGGRIVESEAYKAFQPGMQSTSGTILVKTFFPRGRKANELTGGSLGNVGSYLGGVTRVPGIIGPPMLQLRVRDLFPVMTTDQAAVQFVRETLFTNLAAVQDEATPAAKPQSALAFESKQVTVATIAHWLAAARQVITDAAGLQQYIDNRLIYGLAVVEDDEILNGTGGGTHLEGLLTEEDIQTIAQGTTPSVADDNYADVIRRAMTLVELAEYSASGIVLHPNDWSAIELLKDEDGRYIWARVQETGVRRLWGLPVVTTPKIDEGTFATGAFAQAAALYTREDATVRMSDQHSDFFTKNLVAILAEERLALTVFRPEAVVLGTFTGAGS